MNKHQVKELLIRYHANKCTAQERALLETWYVQQEIPTSLPLSEIVLEEELSKIWRAIENEHFSSNTRKLSWTKLAVAASILIIATLAAVLYQNTQAPISKQNNNIVATQEVQPGGNKAIFVNSSGKKESLNEEVLIAAERINKNETNSYNSLITPKGGQYQLLLPDGTRVWLNAASSIKYPTKFSDKERLVEITGEAYFEVAKHASKPFKVISENQIIEVLGTHFNVNTYTNEPSVKTTLLEGLIKVTSLSNGSKTSYLKPGTQAIHTSNGSVDIIPVNTEESIAWKNGFFQFDDASLETVMRQIARWYDLDVEYIAPVSKRKFNGKVYRNMTLSNLLNILAFSKVNYKIEGKKLLITP